MNVFKNKAVNFELEREMNVECVTDLEVAVTIYRCYMLSGLL